MIRKSLFAAHFAKLFGTAAVAATLCMSASAQAGVLDFETTVDYPFVSANETLTVGNYVIGGYGTEGLVGGLVTNDACFNVKCPVNNPGTYYSALADGYFVLSLANGAAFSISSLAASYIGFGQTSYPAVSGLLYITGFNGDSITSETYLPLAGLIGGNLNFASYDLSGFGAGQTFTDVRFASFACDAAGDCNRNTNAANFAIDDIVTVDASAVPEPGTFALLGLGLAGLAAVTRRRAARAV
jgi:hypothetical protein